MMKERHDQNVADYQYRDSFNLLFNHIEDCLFILNEEGKIIGANKAVIEKLEYAREEITGLNIELAYPLAIRKQVAGIVKSMWVGDISKCSIPLCTKSGKLISVETRVFKGKWEGIDVLFSINKGVSTLEKTEEQLSKALQCKSSITALSSLETGEYLEVNDAFVQTLGYRRDELLGRSAEELDIFLDPKFKKNVISKVIENGCVINCEVMIKDKTGNVHNGLFLGEMVEIVDNKYLLTITSDITELRKQYDKDLKLRNTQLIIEAMPFLAWVKDKSGKYVAVNRACGDFYKAMNIEILGKTDFDIFPYQIALKHRNKEKEIIESEFEQKLHRLHVENETYNEWFEILILPLFDNGKVTGIIGVANNITEKVQLEIELANQKRFLKTMLDTIPDFIFYKDMNGKYLGCNKANADLVLGVSEGEVIGKTDLALTKDSELSKFSRQEGREILVAGKTLKYEEQITLTDGRVIDTETVRAPFFDDLGNVVGTIGIARDITKRKRLEKQLRKHVEYAELLFRTVPSAVLSVDKHRKIIRWNKIAEEITGYTEAEVIGKDCSMIFHGVGQEGCELCRKTCDLPQINQMCNIGAKDGRMKHVLKSVAVVKDELGGIKERMECLEDITSLIEMEDKLRESNERYAAIVNNAPQIVVIIKDGIIKFINDAGKAALGYEEGLIGRHIKNFMTDSSYALSLQLNEIKEERCLTYEIELIKKSGEIINMLLRGTDITFESQRSFLAVMMDITEGKRLNAKLRASEDKFRQVAETINEIFLITNKEGVVYVSPAFEKITGIAAQTLLNNPHDLAKLIHPLDRIRLHTFFPQKFLRGDRAIDEEFRIIRPDGEIRWLWLKSYPVRNDEEDNRGLKATSIVDITERKKIEEKLLERERQTQMELLLAERVQRDSLPHSFLGEKLRVTTIFEPYNTVSGDFFNYKWFEEPKKLCGYIIDVSGHGVATALQTATFKMMLDNILLNGMKIEEDVIQTINQKVMDYLYEDSFVALLYFEFDLQAGVLKLISAGITLYLVAKPEECSLVPIFGCYLGIVNTPEIETKTIPLKSGEIYCLMSDGASDLIELYGTHKQESFAEYKNWLEGLAQNPDRNDDFSVICIEILKEDKKTEIIDVKNDEDLNYAQIIVCKFLERNAPRNANTLEVAINEAMNNGFYAGGRIRVKLKCTDKMVIIRIKDDGPGFVLKGVNQQHKDPMNERNFEESLEAERGRGILIMRLFCDKVIYNAKGNEVLLMKKI